MCAQAVHSWEEGNQRVWSEQFSASQRSFGLQQQSYESQPVETHQHRPEAVQQSLFESLATSFREQESFGVIDRAKSSIRERELQLEERIFSLERVIEQNKRLISELSSQNQELLESRTLGHAHEEKDDERAQTYAQRESDQLRAEVTALRRLVEQLQSENQLLFERSLRGGDTAAGEEVRTRGTNNSRSEQDARNENDCARS